MQQNENDRDLKYEDIQDRYSWHAEERIWTPRQHFTGTLSCMVSINPIQGKLYYFRLLLKHKAGATSFESLRTIDGEIHDTFRSACVASNLCENDTQWIEAMTEAVQISIPFVIRELFC